MNTDRLFLGESKANFDTSEAKGSLVDIAGESYYKITNSDAMRPFFMSIVSDSNHWMFIASNGGLTAGRKDSGHALFPYYTDDKITESADSTGSKSIFRVRSKGKVKLWEPFSDRYIGIYRIFRNLYKNSCGNKVIFEEINEDLGLIFRYQWGSSDQFGFVKKSTLINSSNKEIEVTVLDGIQNIMPYGVDTGLQATSSNLVDAYKKSELETDVGLGIYALSAIIVDKAEPSEALKATTVWSLGIEKPTYLITSLQLDDFRRGKAVVQEEDVRAEKGAYFTITHISLEAHGQKQWMLIADVDQTVTNIAAISEKIKTDSDLMFAVENDMERGTKQLSELTAAADGLQLSADKLRNIRHYANTLFNIMRGGIFDNNYQIEKSDFKKYIKKANVKVFSKVGKILDDLPEQFPLSHLRGIISGLDGDNDGMDFRRLCFEYLPLKFSRRHGDPSRPWNKFSINTKKADGSKILDYQGNWRDIFQNWEALAHSYPEFMEHMMHKFLNATTFDGYNPYRVTRDGFDWETIEADDPWSYIGYWGDHQIIYLLKFLEFMEDYFPNTLTTYFDQDIFVYANVPYRIKGYADILKNPKDTIVLDTDSEKEIIQKRNKLGADGALLSNNGEHIYKVNFIEKLLATVLAKLSNFIPEGGIWMTTQRPEWNDANNALVGNGTSMVTLYYLRRFLNFFEVIVQNSSVENNQVSEALATFFDEIYKTLNDNVQLLSGKISDTDRKSVLDGLGHAGSDYRTLIYNSGFSGNKTNITRTRLLQFLSVSKRFLDHTIDTNQRADRLFHSYNLMTVESESKVSVSHLPEMLEGQVAVLSSGYISTEASLQLLDALKNSTLFRADQYSYVLYPNKRLPRFIQKNTIPSNRANESELIQLLVKNGNGDIVEKDTYGEYHFNGSFHNSASLKEALARLPKEAYESLIVKETDLLLEIFEDIFDHKSFTGRSGTFFGYEGLGSIYWHMVSKLVLAVQEVCLRAIAEGGNTQLIGKLLGHYYEINEGIGVHKPPRLYGAFPTDPYSHTPAGKGAQQPGMTGQVKEDILSRFGELGVVVKDGKLHFAPHLLKKDEFLQAGKIFKYTDVNQKECEIILPVNSICFTCCQVPIVYKLSDKMEVTIHYANGTNKIIAGQGLDTTTSKQIFKREGTIEKIHVELI